jgi:hypothetical protein
VTVVEAVLFVRSIRKRSQVRVNPPSASRTAAPAPLETTPGARTGRRPSTRRRIR